MDILKYIIGLIVACAAIMGLCDTEVVNDIEWTFTIKDGCARVGGDAHSLAVPQSTSGSITIPSSLGGCPVTTIGETAFSNCIGLRSVTIPEGVVRVGQSAFSGCSGLRSIIIPDSVLSPGYKTFDGCSGLVNITMPWRFLTYTEKISTIFPSSYDKIEMLNLTGTAAGIPTEAFKGCASLRSFEIPDSITSIGKDAFSGCRDSLFDTDSIPGVKLMDGWAVGYTSSLSGDLDLTGVRGIGKAAFSGCCSLSSVVIPNGVAGIGFAAFSGCSGLKKMVLPFVGSYKGSGERFGTIFGMDYYSGSVEATQYSSSYSSTKFYLPSLLKCVIITDESQLGHGAFNNCSSLTTIIMLDGVLNIGDMAFAGCCGLTSLTLPDSILSIGSSAFSGCSGITSLNIPSGVSIIETSTFAGCSELTFVTIPDAVTNIGYRAFGNCGWLMDLTIPDSVTTIGNYAFFDCGRLRDIAVPDSVRSIGDRAFSNCGKLANVTIGYGVTNIGNSAFLDCYKLTNFTFKGNAPVVNPSSFNAIASDCIAQIPSWAVGYDVDEDGMWNGLIIERYKALREIQDYAAPEAVTNAIESAGFADEAGVKAAIGGSAAEYAAFKAWAGSVKAAGSTSSASDTVAGEAAVVANTNAAAAYLLGAERLFENKSKVESGVMVVAAGSSNQPYYGDSGGTVATYAIVPANKCCESRWRGDAGGTVGGGAGGWRRSRRECPTIAVLQGGGGAAVGGRAQ